MDTACAAGMYGVGVTWGFRDVEELQTHGAQVIARTSDELLQALRERRSAARQGGNS